MMLSRGAMCLLVSAMLIEGGYCDPRYFLKRQNDHPSENSRRLQDYIGIEPSNEEIDLGQSSSGKLGDSSEEASTFNPEILNKFLQEYASKLKQNSEKAHSNFGSNEPEKLELGSGDESHDFSGSSTEQEIKSDNNFTDYTTSRVDEATFNDTIKRNKFWNADYQPNDERIGWVTLDAVPWSKSKISKWQPNPTTQRPWPESKPNNVYKPWNSDFSSRPSSYDSNKWQARPSKPTYSIDKLNNVVFSFAGNRPRPTPNRPSMFTIDRLETNPNQAQKWPPESQSWNRYGDIITDDGPSNFPATWEQPQLSKPTYTFHTESMINEHGWNDRNDFPSKLSRPDDSYRDRPNFSHYQYPAPSDRPVSHPSSGDGQWVLLSTNRGYSKTRQRSMKFESLNNDTTKKIDGTLPRRKFGEKIPIMSSKRQVRLTVLPSANGTNTTTSHGGLLEVERSFKTVDQSRKELLDKKANVPSTNSASNTMLVNKRPTRHTSLIQPSNSAILAAVGAGMLPATMAMMIPMMLGRRKRSTDNFQLRDRPRRHYDQRTMLYRE